MRLGRDRWVHSEGAGTGLEGSRLRQCWQDNVLASSLRCVSLPSRETTCFPGPKGCVSGVTGGGGGGGRRQLLTAPPAGKASLGPDVRMIVMKRSVGGSMELLKSIVKPPSALSCSALEAVRPGDGDRVCNSFVGQDSQVTAPTQA